MSKVILTLLALVGTWWFSFALIPPPWGWLTMGGALLLVAHLVTSGPSESPKGATKDASDHGTLNDGHGSGTWSATPSNSSMPAASGAAESPGSDSNIGSDHDTSGFGCDTDFNAGGDGGGGDGGGGD